MEDRLHKLQEVCDELATHCRHLNSGRTSIVYPGESTIGKLNEERCQRIGWLNNSESSEKQTLMASTQKQNGNGLSGAANEATWPGIDSRFRLIIVAGLRTKQLLHGSKPRIEVDKKRHRNTSIALEEVKRGLVPFTTFDKPEAHRHAELELNYGNGGASTQKDKRQTARP